MKIIEIRKRHLLNKHLLSPDCPAEGKFQLPQVLPYTGPLPNQFIPYSFKVSGNSHIQGVYCHIHDYGFNTVWTRPFRALSKVGRYMVAVAPDNTLWADGLICENVEQIRRNRTITRFWQSNGVATIQSASWSDAESIETFAFDGLAENGWTAIGHHRKGSSDERKLYKYAINKLVERKHPYGLIVFGLPLDFDPGVQVCVYPSFISKLRNINGKSTSI